MAVFESSVFDDHEQVSFVSEPDSGLRAIIAIHRRGPDGAAVGGCQIAPYPSEAAAVQDALRGSRVTAHQRALTGLPGGGGCSIILADPARQKTHELLRAFGRAIDRLGGRYIATPDAGCTPADMQTIAAETDYVVDHARDVSRETEFGAFVGLESAVGHALGRDDLRGLKVAIEGAGGRGFHLARYLARFGGTTWISDPDDAAAQRVCDEFGATKVDPSEIYDVDVDVFAPCGPTPTLGDETIPRLNAKIVAGAAQRQLVDESRHAAALAERGIFFAPDFVLNAANVIAGALDVATDDEQFHAAACDRARVIAGLLDEIVEQAESASINTYEAALRLARKRLGEANA